MVIICYLLIGVVQLISIERSFRKEYRGEIYDFAASRIDGPMPFDIRKFAMILLAIMVIFFWLPIHLWILIKNALRRIGLMGPDETKEEYAQALKDRKAELKVHDETKELREHYLDVVNRAKRQRDSGEEE